MPKKKSDNSTEDFCKQKVKEYGEPFARVLFAATKILTVINCHESDADLERLIYYDLPKIYTKQEILNAIGAIHIYINEKTITLEEAIRRYLHD